MTKEYRSACGTCGEETFDGQPHKCRYPLASKKWCQWCGMDDGDASHTTNVDCVEALKDEVDRLRAALADLREGIAKHATDTVWCGPAETACDRITAVLDDEWQQSETEKTDG